MPSPQYQISYDEFDVTTGGVAFHYESAYYISGLSILTRGFVYDLADTWIDAEDCASVTWTEVSDL